MDSMSLGLDLETVRAATDMSGLMADTGCSGASCDAILLEFAEHPLWFCDAGPAVGEGGNFIGHLFPGTLFLIWASHWLFGVVRGYFECKAAGRVWESSSCQRGLMFKRSWPIEAAVKASLPLLAMMLELWLAHPGGYRLLICEPGTARAGHFVGNHLNNWAHAAMYIGIIISGLVDLLNTKVELPVGTGQVFLGLAFLAEALLMGLHKKHSPLDVIVHVLLTTSMLSSAVFAFAEAIWPRNFLLICGRIASVYLQGFWFIGAGNILYNGHPRWDPSNGDMAPTMYTPIIYVIHIVTICAIMISAFTCGHVYYLRAAKNSCNPSSSSADCGSRNGPASAFGGGRADALARLSPVPEEETGSGLLGGGPSDEGDEDDKRPMLPISTNGSAGGYSRFS